jgi:dienelactone hydrolase
LNFKQKYAKIRGCKRKIKHKTEAEAVKAKELLESQTGKTCRVYRCGFCFGFHVSCATPEKPLKENSCDASQQSEVERKI